VDTRHGPGAPTGAAGEVACAPVDGGVVDVAMTRGTHLANKPVDLAG